MKRILVENSIDHCGNNTNDWTFTTGSFRIHGQFKCRLLYEAAVACAPTEAWARVPKPESSSYEVER